MKYMLLIYGNEEAFSSVGAESLAEIIRETDALNQELFESGELVGAYGVADQVNAKVVRVTGGTPVVTDGPYAETEEVLAGYWLVDCDGFDRATEIAARLTTCPGPEHVRDRAYVDVRPVAESRAELEP